MSCYSCGTHSNGEVSDLGDSLQGDSLVYSTPHMFSQWECPPVVKEEPSDEVKCESQEPMQGIVWSTSKISLDCFKSLLSDPVSNRIHIDSVLSERTDLLQTHEGMEICIGVSNPGNTPSIGIDTSAGNTVVLPIQILIDTGMH